MIPFVGYVLRQSGYRSARVLADGAGYEGPGGKARRDLEVPAHLSVHELKAFERAAVVAAASAEALISNAKPNPRIEGMA